jgi:pimeloyl-ACP methyl ester carboxylesterase
MLTLILMVGAAGVVVYTAVTNQRIDLTEDIRTIGLELDNPSEVEGLTINVTEDVGGPTPVVYLHDVDVTGGLILAPLSASLPDQYHGVRIDMPGSGYSDRVPFQSQIHTAAGMAEIVAGVLDQRFGEPVLLVGIGFGGNVGAELALTHPGTVSGVVMVDTDLFSRPTSPQHFLQRLPWVGKAATYTWETGGRFALDEWSPYCEQGGWCPTPDELGRRAFIVTIEDTTETLYRFRRTNEAALAPSNLADISVPIAYVWSLDGPIERSTIDRLSEGLPGIEVVDSSTFQAHLEDHDAVNSAIVALSG